MLHRTKKLNKRWRIRLRIISANSKQCVWREIKAGKRPYVCSSLPEQSRTSRQDTSRSEVRTCYRYSWCTRRSQRHNCHCYRCSRISHTCLSTGARARRSKTIRTYNTTTSSVKCLNAIARYGKPISELRSVTCRMRSHCPKFCDGFVLKAALCTTFTFYLCAEFSAVRHRLTCPAITPVKQAGTTFTYPRRMKGWFEYRDNLPVPSTH